MTPLILIIEDERDILELMEYHLTKEGFEVIGFLNTKNVEQILSQESVDLILMDRNLPNVEGSDFIDSLRKKGLKTPVIFVTAKDRDVDIHRGFESGGDDYITKPFSTKELILRIKAMLRRTKKEYTQNIMHYRDIVLNIDTHSVMVNNESIELTKLEFNLLRTLMLNEGVVLDRDYLLDCVWGNDDIYQDKTVNVAINRLKDKIDPDKNRDYIKTVRGVGYTLC